MEAHLITTAYILSTINPESYDLIVGNLFDFFPVCLPKVTVQLPCFREIEADLAFKAFSIGAGQQLLELS
jgi:hypothetical protein